MANHMETYINIKNGDINVAEKLKEIFTPPDTEEARRLIKVIPLNEMPQYQQLKELIEKYNLTVTIEHIKKSWRPPVLHFEGQSDDEEDVVTDDE